MEENYAAVVFRNKDRPPKVENEEQTLYSNIRIAPAEKVEQICSEVQTKAANEEASGPAAECEAAANVHRLQVLAACVVTLCVVLLVVIAILIYFVVTMNDERVKLSVENQHLITEKRILESETEQAMGQRDSLNRTMGVIMTFNSFPVDRFCPQKKCQPCQTGWIQFQEKCYYLYSNNWGWKTWRDSREYCQRENSDLIVIETVQEQEFISENIKSYHSEFHGFWIGLREDSDQIWRWVDGRNDTLGHWIQEPFGPVGSYALMIPGRPTNASWDKAENGMRNKFICEQQVLIKSF